ncbi:MAG: cycH [Mucilaginibacter sp.]|nr:cycH [Mucilaginibacter sp.]
MSALPIIGFVLVALLAVAFAVVPLVYGWEKKRALLMAAIALFMLGIGGGVYWMVGRPQLARRAAQGLNTHDMKGLVPYLIAQLRKTPNDVRGWRYLGQVYMTANDPVDAAKALAKAIALTGHGDPELDAAYGEALVLSNNGVVPDAAETAFQDALRADPSNPPARFYLGLARVQHKDKLGAIAYWQSLLNEAPPTSQLHQMLVDRLAALTAQSGGRPDPRQMVAMLAARLKADPNDALGWVRLINAYTVLGEMDKAKDALATARATFKGNKDAQTAFDSIAKQIK